MDINADLQWSEGSYRGFFTLTIDSNTLNATYYAMNNVSAYQDISLFFQGRLFIEYTFQGFANLDAFASAHFVVENGTSFPVWKTITFLSLFLLQERTR